MAELPPPPNPQDGRGDLTPERAARLERLDRRRNASTASGPTGPTPDQAARLERLAQRRAGTSANSAGGPTPDQAARLEKLARRSRGDGAGGATGATGGSRPTRRKHPAKNARTAALGMSLATTAGLAGAFATMNRSAAAESAGSSSAVIVSGGPTTTAASAPQSALASNRQSTSQSGTSRSVDVPVPAPESATTPTTPATTAAPATPAQPTVVDGAVSRTRWGPVQVEATFAADGSLVDVVALQAPNDRSTSLRISNYAVPRLTDEALTAQAASVHTISGATYTSDGYRQSLQSAIDAARSAGVTTIA